eukprot:8164847-Heterocapsa_arctica.AAC.1
MRDKGTCDAGKSCEYSHKSEVWACVWVWVFVCEGVGVGVRSPLAQAPRGSSGDRRPAARPAAVRFIKSSPGPGLAHHLLQPQDRSGSTLN